MVTWYHIVGTSHIARQAVTEVSRAFEEFSPDAVAVELDPPRMHALLSKEGKRQSFFQLLHVVGVKGALFALIGSYAQKKLGRIVGMEPGADMLAAVELAQKHKKKLLLIDRDLALTLQRLNKAMGWRELRQLCKDLWRGLLGNERFTIDLNTTPEAELVVRLLDEFKGRYPRPYRTLVHERNIVMVRNLQRFHDQHPDEKILVVVGAGHVPGLCQLLAAARSSSSRGTA